MVKVSKRRKNKRNNEVEGAHQEFRTAKPDSVPPFTFTYRDPFPSGGKEDSSNRL